VKPSIKYQAIYKNRYGYSISFLCGFFEVSRSGYYAWLARKDVDRDAALGEMIRECQKKTKETYGYRRVRLWLLHKKGLHVNGKAVLRIMQKYGLLSEIRRPGPYQKGISRFKTYENQLQQDFRASKPNEKWVTDISYVHTKQGTLYLAVIKDLYDRSIVAYEAATKQDNGMVCRVVQKQATKSGEVCCCIAIRVPNMLRRSIMPCPRNTDSCLPCPERRLRWTTLLLRVFSA